jgi:hypothetical protein
VTVRFVETLRQLVGLLEARRLHAAAPPSLVNLEAILGPRIRLERAVGWESVFLDFKGSSLDASERASIARGIDREALVEAFVRDSGEVLDQLPAALGGGTARALPIGRPPTRRVQIAIPSGDELLELMQEAIFSQLDAIGVEADLVGVDQTTLYGAWKRSNPTDAALRRGTGGPSFVSDGNERGGEMETYPLFRVASFVATSRDVHGPVPNPTFEGPLWNVERWWRSPPDRG